MSLMARKLLLQEQVPWPENKLFTTAGTYEVKLPPGNYRFTYAGGGGAGGQKGGHHAYSDTDISAAVLVGKGGAGAAGTRSSFTQSFNTVKVVRVHVGAGGKTYVNGGNGGPSDGSRVPNAEYGLNVIGGAGGGGGFPTVIEWDNSVWYYANGGAGGGGGGAAGYAYHRYPPAGCGGGGGGRYSYAGRTSAGVIEYSNWPGQMGGRGGGQDRGLGIAGVNGWANNGATLVSGKGGGSMGGAGASYAGAGGGGGFGGQSGNHESGREDNAYSSGGGGGAGGDERAGGGGGGYVPRISDHMGADASNHFTDPANVLNHVGQTVTSGYGRGGYGGTYDRGETNGYDGFVYIERI